jgi:hypothetical protein
MIIWNSKESRRWFSGKNPLLDGLSRLDLVKYDIMGMGELQHCVFMTGGLSMNSSRRRH